MTFAEAYAAMRALGEQRGHKTLALKIEAWSIEGRESLRWEIWCGDLNEHFTGHSAVAALASYRENIAAGDATSTPAALAAIGSAEVSPC